MTNRASRLLAAAVLAALSGAARAEEGAGTVYPRDKYPFAELTKQPLTLSAGLIRLDVPVVANLTSGEAFKPWYIPPALALGLTDDVEVGVFHDVGLCLAGTSNGCHKVYDDVGGRIGLSLVRDPGGQLALDVGVHASNFSDVLYDGRALLGYKRTLANLAIVLDAGILSFLNKRSQLPFKDAFLADGELQVQLAEGVAVLGRVGVRRAITTASGVTARTTAPVAVGIEVEPVHKVDLGAELEFDNLLGEDATTKERTGVAYARLFF